MCRECDWSDKTEEERFIRTCDCGNMKWKKVAWTEPSVVFGSYEDGEITYRCTKCDGLFSYSKKGEG